MSVTFSPFGTQILATRAEPPKKQSALIQLEGDGLAAYYDVVAVGPEVRDVRKGQRIVASRMAGQDLELSSGPHVLLSEAAVMAVVA